MKRSLNSPSLMSQPGKVISFRLNQALYNRLASAAKRLKTPTSSSSCAKQIVSEHLEKREAREDAIAFELTHLRNEIKQQRVAFERELTTLRKDLHLAVKALLVTKSGSEAITPEDAANWVAINLAANE